MQHPVTTSGVSKCAFIMSDTQQMSSVWESVVAEIEEKLLTLKASDLNELCATLSLTIHKDDTDIPRKLRRQILQFIEGEDVISREDEGMSLLLELNDRIDELTGKMNECGEGLPQNKDQMRENEMGANNPGQKEKVFASSPSVPVTTESVSFVHPIYRRDLKITGQIGEPNQKETLTYSSLERQIQRALKKGYDEGETVEGQN